MGRSDHRFGTIALSLSRLLWESLRCNQHRPGAILARSGPVYSWEIFINVPLAQLNVGNMGPLLLRLPLPFYPPYRLSSEQGYMHGVTSQPDAKTSALSVHAISPDFSHQPTVERESCDLY